MQVTVYIPKELENKVTEIAARDNTSIQQVLLSPWKGGRSEVVTKSVDGRLDDIECKLAGIESKLDGLFGCEKNGSKPRAFFETSHKDVKGTPADVIEKVIKTVGDVPGWAGGYSKSKQLGKKK